MWLYLPTSVCSAAPEDLTSPSESQFQMLAASVSAKGKSAQPAFWRRAWKTGALNLLQSGLMCEPSLANSSVIAWMESWADSPAKTYQSRDHEPDLMEKNQASGGNMPESSLKLDLPGCSSKTCQVCSQPADRDFDAYAAGILDGEGSLTVRSDAEHSSCTVIMQITMAAKAAAVLNAIYWTYGGAIRPIDGRKPQESSTIKWQMSGKGLLCVLRRLRPFLYLKREQLDICLALLETEWPSYNGNEKVTPERLAAFQQAKEKIESLNQRGPADNPPNYVAQLVGNKWMVRKVSLFGEHWETFSGPFPASGTLRNGCVFERPTWERRIGGSASLSSRGEGNGGGQWPTVTCNRATYRGAKSEGGALHLPGLVRAWPSPRSEDSEACGNHPGAVDSLGGGCEALDDPAVTRHAPRQTGTGRTLRNGSGGGKLDG